MKPADIIAQLAANVCPEPAELRTRKTEAAGKTILFLLTTERNISRLVGRKGATIAALNLFAEIMDPSLTISLPDTMPPESLQGDPVTICDRLQLMTALCNATGLDCAVQDDATALVLILPPDAPETVSLAMTTFAKAAGRNPKPVIIA